VNPPEDNLRAALDRHGMQLADPQIERLEQYCRLLWDWNEKLNLTRHTTFDRFVTRDLVDSQAFGRFLNEGEQVLDVGTGGGVPGVVLAVLRQDLQISLCESIAKKAKVVADIVEKLGLPAAAIHARAEDLLGQQRFSTLVIRAVARLKKLLEWFNPHWEAFDRMLVLKGPGWIEERGEARHFGLMHGLALRKLDAYPLPGTESESVMLQISRLN
jgi:16S rRNA (guanine527-N7)-methyltransferase